MILISIGREIKMNVFKCLSTICLFLLIFGCTNEETFEEFFDKSMNDIKYAEIIRVDEYEQGTIVLVSMSSL